MQSFFLKIFLCLASIFIRLKVYKHCIMTAKQKDAYDKRPFIAFVRYLKLLDVTQSQAVWIWPSCHKLQRTQHRQMLVCRRWNKTQYIISFCWNMGSCAASNFTDHLWLNTITFSYSYTLKTFAISALALNYTEFVSNALSRKLLLALWNSMRQGTCCDDHRIKTWNNISSVIFV